MYISLLLYCILSGKCIFHNFLICFVEDFVTVMMIKVRTVQFFEGKILKSGISLIMSSVMLRKTPRTENITVVKSS